MKTAAYLIVELSTDQYDRPTTGKMRTVKNKPDYLNPRELAFEVNLEIPDVFFKRMIPVVDIKLPVDMLINPDPEVVVGITAGKVASALRLDVETVTDGLTQMLKEAQEKQ